jgi:hypothetical protein
MKKITLILMLLLPFCAKAQEEFENPYFEFSEGEELKLLNATTLYQSPDLNAEIIDKIPLGTPIKIISKTENIYEKKGNKAPYYQISILNKKSEKRGYVWAGDISLKVENYSKNQKISFLFGVSRVVPFNEKENEQGELFIVCKIISSKKLLSQIEFKSIGLFDNYRILNVYDNKKLKGIKNILSFGYKNIFNSGIYGEQVFFWDGSEILPVRNIENIADPPCYYSEELIFPNDSNGKEGRILIQSNNGCNEGEEKIETKMSEFVWQKNRLVLIKESKID